MAMGDEIKRNLKELLEAGGYGEQTSAPYSTNLAETSKEVQRRVRALKKYQLESIDLESKFYHRVHELEKEFQPMFNAINLKRKAVDELQKLENNAPVEGTPSKGVPGFWFYALNNASQISDMIHEYDAPILKFLVDISLQVHTDPTGFSLLFHFAENPYFTNAILTKYYELKIAPDNDDPFGFDGPTVVKSEGTLIDWKMQERHSESRQEEAKGAGAGRFMDEDRAKRQFLQLFRCCCQRAEIEHGVRVDFETGQVIRDQIVPRAVLFFTGEGVEDEDFDDFDEDEDDEDSDGASDGNDDEDR
uniref:Nucleosome assembly protein n=1 Tax=Ditylenchus dipsaci TaxID=166011 RepID=A0A915E1E0_9BILA